MKNRKLIKKIITALLSLSLCIAAAMPTFALGAGQVIDASRPGSLYNETLDSVELLDKVLDSYSPEYEIGDAERSYLLAYGDTELVYNYGVGSNNVVAEYDEQTGRLSVVAYEYSFENAAGERVVWIPRSAELFGETHRLTSSGTDGYATVFSDVPADDELASVKITYSLDVSLDKDVINVLVNKAYNDAPSLIAEHEMRVAEYEAKLREYNEAKAEYDAYLASLAKYKSDLKKYNDYLAALKVYNEKLERYEKYLLEKAEYDSAYALYEKYLADVEEYERQSAAYLDYVAAMAAYEKALVDYDDNQKKRELCLTHIKIMWLCAANMQEDTHDIRSLLKYSSLIDEILAEKATFTGDFGDAPPLVFDMAYEATENLKVLVGSYFSSADEYEKYAFYANHYDDIREGFANLFISLHHLQKNPRINAAIIAQGQAYEFNVFLAGIYLLAQRLTDGDLLSVDPALIKGTYGAETYSQYVYRDEEYRGVFGKTLYEIIDGYTPPPDNNNSKPVEGGLPYPMEKPQKPVAVEEPTRPDYVSRPVEIETVEPAGTPPTPVTNPGKAPTEVAEPAAPTPYVQDSIKAAVISDYNSGKIGKRELVFNTDPTVTFTTDVQKRFINVSQCSVRFYDTAGESTLYSTVVDSGSMADYIGPIPTKAQDDRAVYTFDYWVDREGNRVDLSRVESDLTLYPHFAETLRSYTVSWNVDGRIFDTVFLYGELPTFDGSPTRADSDYYEYTFSGWDKPVLPVSGSATYTALFRADYIVPVTGGGASVTVLGDSYRVDLTSSNDGRVNIIGALSRAAARDFSVTVNIKTLTVTIDKDTVKELDKSGACYVSALVSQTGNLSYGYTVSLEDGRADTSDRHKLYVSAKCTLEPSERLRLRYTSGGTTKYQKYTLGSGVVSFEATSGVSYYLSYEYNLITAVSTLVNLGIKAGTYSVGEMVLLKPEIPGGVSIKQMYYTDSEGRKTVITENCFVMPAKDITVSVEAERVKYKITFISEGKSVYEQYCYYGELPSAPQNVQKAQDGKYTYTFKGWDKQISEVTGDTTYTAVYESVEIGEKLDTDKTFSMSQKAVMAAFAAVIGVMMVAIVALIIKIRSI